MVAVRLLILALLGLSTSLRADDRPNFLWLTTEDIGPELGCYGDTYATTPQIDSFARRSTIYQNAWANAPVCAPSRTTIISGLEGSSLGAEHMRSLVPAPAKIAQYPTLLRQGGYFCINPGKEDFNIQTSKELWNTANKKNPWPELKSHQPFLAVFNFNGTHESQIRKRPHEAVHDPAAAKLPPYHPDHPKVRQDWAQYYDNITRLDEWFANHLSQLENHGLTENTIVFFYGDHGSGMPRHKRSLQNSGLRVPLIVSVPKKFQHLLPADIPAAGNADRLVALIDLAPTLLSLAGLPIPAEYQGHAFLGKSASEPQSYLYGFRGRMDERIDLSRTVRNKRYHYIRHYMPHRLAGAHNAYMFQTPTAQVWRELYDAGKLNAAQSVFFEPKSPEELYDLEKDPHEIQNLIASPEHQEILNELRAEHVRHLLEIRDAGFLPEDELHTRAPGMSPYDLARDGERYPLGPIFEMAHVASLRTPDAIDRLTAGLQHHDSAVRYWAAMGFLNRGESAVSQASELLRETVLNDASPSVRTVAAEALGRFGPIETLTTALDWLVHAADGEKTGAYVSIIALEALDQTDGRASPVKQQIENLPRMGSWQSPRNASYADRLIESIMAGIDKK